MNRDNFPKVSTGEFAEILNDIWRLPNKDRPAVCLWGDPGLGKTSCVQAWGDYVNTISVSTLSDPADILGMPEKTSAGTTRMLKPDWVTIKPSSGRRPSGDTKPAHKNVYLFDDFNRANNLVINALMPLILFKKTQSWELDTSALIVLTANFPDKTNLVNLQSFTDQAIQERLLNFECKFEGAFKSWMSWAQDQDSLSQKGLSWLKQEPELMSSGRGRNPRAVSRFLMLIKPISESDLKGQFGRVKLLAQGAGIDDILINSFESFVFGKQKKKLFTAEQTEGKNCPSPSTISRWIDSPDRHLTLARLQRMAEIINVDMASFVFLEVEGSDRSVSLANILDNIQSIGGLFGDRARKEVSTTYYYEELELLRFVLKKEIPYLRTTDSKILADIDSGTILLPNPSTRHKNLLRPDEMLLLLFEDQDKGQLFRRGLGLIENAEVKNNTLSLKLRMLASYPKNTRATLKEHFHHTLGKVDRWPEIRSHIIFNQKAINKIKAEGGQLLELHKNQVEEPSTSKVENLLYITSLLKSELGLNRTRIVEQLTSGDDDWSSENELFKRGGFDKKRANTFQQTLIRMAYRGATEIEVDDIKKVLLDLPTPTTHHSTKRPSEEKRTDHSNFIRVILVMLRRPNRKDPNEMRSDPFWEFQSFGCTNLHKNNVMNPKKLHELVGANLAFAQVGYDGYKLVYLTPPLNVIKQHPNTGEVKWESEAPRMPFKYKAAPLLINSDGGTCFPEVKQYIEDVNRSSYPSRFAARFRSRRGPLPVRIANQISEIFTEKYDQADKDDIASCYSEALPYEPPHLDTDRQATYNQYILKANESIES